jgi:hypothetical protein
VVPRLDTFERNERRQNENLKRAGIKLADHNGEEPRLGYASRVEALVQQTLTFPTSTLDPEKSRLQVSEATCTRTGALLQSSNDGESLGDGILLDSVLQSSKVFKDARCMLLNECQELVMEKNRLNAQAIALYKETKRANPSTKSKAPEDYSDHGSKVSALVARASSDEYTGNCVIKAKKLFDAIFADWEEASQLQEQLVHIVERQQAELASRNKAFKDWQTKSEELLKKKAKLQNLLASVKEEESSHYQAL